MSRRVREEVSNKSCVKSKEPARLRAQYWNKVQKMKWQIVNRRAAALGFCGLARTTQAFLSLPQLSSQTYPRLSVMMSTFEKKICKPYGNDIPPEEREIWRPRPPSVVAGTIPIISGRLLISDPCYERNLGGRTRYMAEIEMVPNPNYEVRYTVYGNDLGFVGLYHPDYKDAIPDEVAFDEVGVDSATISFSDVDHKVALGENAEWIEAMHEGGHSYCSVVDWHGLNVAFVTTDDGGYPVVVARNEDDKIIAAEVHFVWDL
eukprot:scaffold2095_cov166-Amphora_coffeaeformis.AAC.4